MRGASRFARSLGLLLGAAALGWVGCVVGPNLEDCAVYPHAGCGAAGNGGAGGSGGGGCTSVDDCTNASACTTAACVNSQCELTPVAEGTALPMDQQTAGDCKLVVCGSDGQPNPQPQEDATDVPVSLECNMGACNGSMPVQNPTPMAMCGPGDVGTCDAQGVCKLPLGTACTTDDNCTSSHCVDGVCCNATCAFTCFACNVAGALGFCTTLPVGEQDPTATTPCTAPQACDGGGVCIDKLPNGSMCNSGPECASGQCNNNVCVTP